MKSFMILCAALCISATAYSQRMVTGQYAIDDSRYEGMEKGPYLFKEFTKGIATNSRIGENVEYLLNYNGYSQEFEFIHNDIKSEMDAAYYNMIEISDYTPSEHYSDKYVSPSIKFVKGLDPKAPKSFSIVVYEDENVMLYKNFVVKTSRREINDPTQGIVEIESFVPNFQYFLKVGDQTKSIGLSKKKVESQLAHSKISTFIKKNKLKLKTEAELAKVISYYSDLKTSESTDALPIASAND